jgi:hypothetical protein
MTHVRLSVDTTLEHLLYGVTSVRTGIEREDKFRLVTGEDSQFGIKLNCPVEQAIAVKFAFLRDAQDAVRKAAEALAQDAGFTINWEVTKRDNQELFDQLRASRARRRWYDTGHWRTLCLYASFMQLDGWAAAEAEQVLDHPEYWEGRGTIELQMRAVLAEDHESSEVAPATA